MSTPAERLAEYDRKKKVKEAMYIVELCYEALINRKLRELEKEGKL